MGLSLGVPLALALLYASEVNDNQDRSVKGNGKSGSISAKVYFTIQYPRTLGLCRSLLSWLVASQSGSVGFSRARYYRMKKIPVSKSSLSRPIEPRSRGLDIKGPDRRSSAICVTRVI